MNVSIWLITLLLLVHTLTSSSSGLFGQKPGFRLMFTKKGLDYVFGPVLKDGLKQLSIPDIEDEKKVSVVGKVKYSLKRISVHDVTVPSTSLEGRENQMLSINIGGMSLAMHAKWKYKKKNWPKLGDDGSVDLKAKDLSLSQAVSLTNDGSGRLQVTAKDCSFNVREISVKFHGGVSWLYNLFTSYVERKIKDNLKREICKMVTEKLNEFGTELTTNFPLSIPVSDGVEISCALIDHPILSSSYLLTNHNGECIAKEYPQEVPLSPHDLPPPSTVDPTSKMVYLWLTGYTLDTAGFIYRKMAFMEYRITHDQIPDILPKTTHDFKYIVPELYEQFPDMAIEYGADVTKPPYLVLRSDQAFVVAETEICVYVLKSDDQPHFAFSLTVSVDCDVKPKVETRSSGQYLFGDIASSLGEILTVASEIGDFDLAPFRELVNSVTKFILLPQISRYIESGVAIPSYNGLTITNTLITIEEGCILIGTDLSYSV